MTTTTTRTRKPRTKPERKVNISRPVNGTYALHMTIGTGEKAQRFGYYLTPFPADFGLGFHVEKFGVEQVEGEPTSYDVNIDPQHGHHTCDCKGNQRWNHCKHVEATLALLVAGKIATPQSKPAEVPVVTNAEEPMARVLLGSEQHRQEMAARQVNPVCFACELPYEQCQLYLTRKEPPGESPTPPTGGGNHPCFAIC